MKNNGYELVLCAVRPAVDKVRNFGLKPLVPICTAAETCEYRARPCKAARCVRMTSFRPAKYEFLFIFFSRSFCHA